MEVSLDPIHSTSLWKMSGPSWASRVHSRASCLLSLSSRNASFWHCSAVKISMSLRSAIAEVTSRSSWCASRTVTMARLCTAYICIHTMGDKKWQHTHTKVKYEEQWYTKKPHDRSLPYTVPSAVIGPPALEEEECHEISHCKVRDHSLELTRPGYSEGWLSR